MLIPTCLLPFEAMRTGFELLLETDFYGSQRNGNVQDEVHCSATIPTDKMVEK